eukprot:maker-scaffold_11-snap-gene-3.2-mRNA-1 protein AED:0.21 eAED:0.21 QI:145/1/1/1/1/1/2/125/213
MSWNPIQKYRENQAQKKLMRITVELKMTKKQFQRQAGKMEKQADASKAKLKKALEGSPPDVELAKIHAESCVHQKKQAANFAKLASRVEIVQDRVRQAQAMQSLTKEMTKVTKGLDVALSAMDPEQLAAVLDKFEGVNESIDILDEHTRNTIGNTVAGTTPEQDVRTLMEEVGADLGDEVLDLLEQDKPLPTNIQVAETEQVPEKQAAMENAA